MKTKTYILEMVIRSKDKDLKSLQLDLIKNSDAIKSHFNPIDDQLQLNSFVPQIENNEILIRFILDDSRPPAIIRCGYPIASNLYVSLYKAGISPIPIGYNYIEMDNGDEILQDTSEFGAAQLIDIFAECCRPESGVLTDSEDVAEFAINCNSAILGAENEDLVIFNDIHDVFDNLNETNDCIKFDDFVDSVKLYLDIDFSSPVNDSPLIVASECRTIESFKQDVLAAVSDGIKSTIIKNKKYLALMASIMFLYIYTKIIYSRKNKK